MWYFAYASNMNRRQVEVRVQRAQLRWMAARLDGYALQFNKRSRVDQSGKANIVPDGSGVVWGVLFELSEEEFQRLARFEGGYSRQTIEIACIEPPFQVPCRNLRGEAWRIRPASYQSISSDHPRRSARA